MRNNPKRPNRLAYLTNIVFLFSFVMAAPALAVEIIAFGDSITAGTGSEAGGYPPQLEQLIKSTGKPVHIYNLGVPGERTDQGVERISAVLDTIPADAILILEGTNDIRSGFPWQTTKLNLQLMINIAKAKGVTPILSTLTPSDQNNSEALIPQRYNPMIRELAEQNGLTLVDQYTAVKEHWESLNNDGIHPNDEGYLYLAKAWDQILEKLISPTGEFHAPHQYIIFFILSAIAAFLVIYRFFRKKVKLRTPSTLAPLKFRRNR